MSQQHTAAHAADGSASDEAGLFGDPVLLQLAALSRGES